MDGQKLSPDKDWQGRPVELNLSELIELEGIEEKTEARVKMVAADLLALVGKLAHLRELRATALLQQRQDVRASGELQDAIIDKVERENNALREELTRVEGECRLLRDGQEDLRRQVMEQEGRIAGLRRLIGDKDRLIHTLQNGDPT